MRDTGYAPTEILIALLVFIVIIGGGLLVYKHEHKTSDIMKNTKTQALATNPDYSVLSPATVPSKIAECSQSVSYASNGVPGPVLCSNGDLNTADWYALAALEPSALKLGYDATASQVQTALCNDVRTNISNPIELAVYQIAQMYYGWNFSTNPNVVLTNGTCNNVDD